MESFHVFLILQFDCTVFSDSGGTKTRDNPLVKLSLEEYPISLFNANVPDISGTNPSLPGTTTELTQSENL